MEEKLQKLCTQAQSAYSEAFFGGEAKCRRKRAKGISSGIVSLFAVHPSAKHQHDALYQQTCHCPFPPSTILAHTFFCAQCQQIAGRLRHLMVVGPEQVLLSLS